MLQPMTLLAVLPLLAEAYMISAQPHGAGMAAQSVPLPSPAVVSRAAPPRLSFTPTELTSLEALTGAYDAFFLDQFGVIHDGKRAYEGAVDAVRHLQARGARIVIISNSSRRRSDTIARLRAMGFGPFAEEAGAEAALTPISVVTSGELVWQGLAGGAKGAEGVFKGLGGDRCFCFGNGADDEEYLASAGLHRADIDEADFILARGLFSVVGVAEQPYSAALEAQLLERALARQPGGLPLLVANPDTVRPDGNDSPMPGMLAQRYAAAGAADIRLVGKPYPLVYSACFDALEAQMSAAAGDAKETAEASASAAAARGARVIAVGDSLHHDVLGAARAGVDSLLVCSGVHYAELGVAQASAEEPAPERLQALLGGFAVEHEGLAPTHCVAAFRL